MKPTIIAGPCVAESYEIMSEVASVLCSLSKSLNFDYYFKASFDKANRSAIHNYRGPGLEEAMQWFRELKKQFACKILTDVHEVEQVSRVAPYVDALQIPAFLCRQTDLLVAAVKTGKRVNIKKGQFVAPAAMEHIVGKAISAAAEAKLVPSVSLTERGSSFGYGDLVVDMRAFPIMARSGVPLIFDITHSTQRPPSGDASVSLASREFAPILARAATATGYLAGFFLEVHPNPDRAKSDAQAQLSIPQAGTLLQQLVPLWRSVQSLKEIDVVF